VFYKRFSAASSADELTDLRAELVDRYGEPTDEVDNLSELMLLKVEMRELRLRGLETGPGRLVFTLGTEAALDPLKLAALVQRSKGLYRLTPEMKLVVRVKDGAAGQELVAEAKKTLRDLTRVEASG
jgi:transcription-repair coupling factor (superfamily II helicase)